MPKVIRVLQDALDRTRAADFLAPLALRLFLAPIFIQSGWNKLANADRIAPFFESLGLPAPELMVYLSGVAEFAGGWLLLIGLAVRWAAIPLMFTMIVAAVTVHWEHGWHVLPETQLTAPWEWREDLIEGAVERRAMARTLLRRHGNYEWLTETGSITILKNGIEFAAIYFIMLLPLFFSGAGRLSLDHLLAKRLE
jgi:uncharacterized membrane protein YphA (DoxX/SURF4 family)